MYFHVHASTRRVHYITPVSMVHANTYRECLVSIVVVPCKIMHVKIKLQLSRTANLRITGDNDVLDIYAHNTGIMGAIITKCNVIFLA